ncbi:hypothetical protein GY45DRAFT_310929 [Cubamyces sp. BRFM 1775]|nr:hypothetical protein GY45DRAFT_310929 [Cubamyces sp. BRFM 1775]
MNMLACPRVFHIALVAGGFPPTKLELRRLPQNLSTTPRFPIQPPTVDRENVTAQSTRMESRNDRTTRLQFI